jgi:hypothetical protein
MLELLFQDAIFLGFIVGAYFYVDREFSQLRAELSCQKDVHVHIHGKEGAQQCVQVHGMCTLNRDLEDYIHCRTAIRENNSTVDLDELGLSDSPSEPEIIERADADVHEFASSADAYLLM